MKIRVIQAEHDSAVRFYSVRFLESSLKRRGRNWGYEELRKYFRDNVGDVSIERIRIDRTDATSKDLEIMESMRREITSWHYGRNLDNPYTTGLGEEELVDYPGAQFPKSEDSLERVAG